MKKIFIVSLHIMIVFFLLQHCYAGSWFDKSEYSARRAKFMEQIPDGVAVILGATTPASDRQFLQGSDFFCFTGVEIPNAVLITENGYENLSHGIPRSVAEIEALMKKK
jgi:hypothetical protein